MATALYLLLSFGTGLAYGAGNFYLCVGLLIAAVFVGVKFVW